MSTETSLYVLDFTPYKKPRPKQAKALKPWTPPAPSTAKPKTVWGLKYPPLIQDKMPKGYTNWDVRVPVEGAGSWGIQRCIWVEGGMSGLFAVESYHIFDSRVARDEAVDQMYREMPFLVKTDRIVFVYFRIRSDGSTYEEKN